MTTHQTAESNRRPLDLGLGRSKTARGIGPFMSGRVNELGSVLAGFFAIVVIVAGGSSVALLVWPSASRTYFSWNLGPAPVAALIGGLYLASVIVFLEAATRPRQETRSVTVGVLGLALPTLLFTTVERDVFDWTRPQAIAWVVLFCSAPLAILLDVRSPTPVDESPKASMVARVALAGVSLAASGLAVGLWAEASRGWLDSRSPIPLGGLTADDLGAWCAFVAVASLVALGRGRVSDIRSIGILLGAIAAGAALAATRTMFDLRANASAYLVGLGALAAIALGLLIGCRQGSSSASQGRP